MSNPISELILDNVVTTLQGITVAANYEQTVSAVHRLRPVEVPDPTVFPTLTCWIEEESRSQDNMTYTDHRATLVVRGYTASGDDPSLALEKLMADVEKALAVDITRGGYAIDTAAVGAIEREAVMDAGFGGRGVAYAEFEIWYRTKRGNPYSQ